MRHPPDQWARDASEGRSIGCSAGVSPPAPAGRASCPRLLGPRVGLGWTSFQGRAKLPACGRGTLPPQRARRPRYHIFPRVSRKGQSFPLLCGAPIRAGSPCCRKVPSAFICNSAFAIQHLISSPLQGSLSSPSADGRLFQRAVNFT
jgi:hypothetical protein